MLINYSTQQRKRADYLDVRQFFRFDLHIHLVALVKPVHAHLMRRRELALIHRQLSYRHRISAKWKISTLLSKCSW